MPSLGGNEGEQAGKLSRRNFARAAVKAGMGASAAIWVAPQLSSVTLAQTTAGSPPPSTTRPREDSAGEPFDPGGTGRAPGGTSNDGGTGTPGAGTPGAGGQLASTGINARALAATGGAAVLTGSALVGAERLSRRSRPPPTAKDPSDETG